MLPLKEAFFSLLTQQHISEEHYQHPLHIWNVFECKTIGDYHDLCVKTDILLLTTECL